MSVRLEKIAANQWVAEDRFDVLLVSDGEMSSYIVFDDAEPVEEVFSLEGAIEVIEDRKRAS